MAKAKKKFNPKYLKGSPDKPKRKQLMELTAKIYEKYRGGKKKKPFPPEVKERLKEIMKQRDKI
jgi:hypothetical protein